VRRPIVLAALLLASGCGSSSPSPTPTPQPGRTVAGETESGMKLKVETFISPASDPVVKRIDSWRSRAHYPAVDYHRVTADNSAGTVADSGRIVRFAPDLPSLSAGRAVDTRFSCDALAYEWLPPSPGQTDAWNGLRRDVCAAGPPKPDGIAPGAKQVYYLITDRTFGARGIRTMKVFGPRDVEFR
jgi:hypothetical protein